MPKKLLRLAYAGAARTDDSIVHAFYEADHHCTLVDPDKAIVLNEPFPGMNIGDVWLFDAGEDGKALERDSGKKVGKIGEPMLLVSWQARDSAIMASEVAWSRGKLGATFDVLAPIREAYHRLPEEEQGVLIAQVVRFIVQRK